MNWFERKIHWLGVLLFMAGVFITTVGAPILGVPVCVLACILAD